MIEIPVTLGAIEGFFALAFFVIAFIGWILNLINQSQEANQRNRKPGQGAGGKREKVQQDIDDFLNQNRRQKNQNAGGGELVAANEVEVVERRTRPTPQGRRPPANRQRSRKEVWDEQTGKAAPKEQQPPKRTQTGRPKVQVKQAPQPAAKGPGSIAAQLGQAIHDRPSPTSDAVGKSLAHQVDASVSAHLGAFRADDPKSLGRQGMDETTADRITPAARLLGMMRTKQGIKQAIVLGEVLSKPRVLRRS